ncbi:unnamed protein product (macronuclear) [Paramecium tetraurelia]|uniref:PX domain-containing protein n=1 Tax=Paramecium tetraurelia TaxID=5888 RepID=A0BWX9_PARTE|nr:uncharacterized protein GSPATT00032898001 [Paramecium tetraurelia]CAK63046.1 unnamed protein product [Paramecium tetraurelia]|eukprot:XP_001430444.1 hypothetical protein (macronuclear) [Paramecium tetraurelia strain d4-2]
MLVQRFKAQLNHEIQNDKVHYKITVTNLNNEKETKTTTSRYSEIKDFHDQLHKNITLLKLQLQLPQFPGRSLFSKTNKNEERIQQRQFELEVYFNELLSIEKILSLTPFQQYLPLETDQKQQQNINNIFRMNITIKIENYALYDDVVVYSLRFKNNYTNDEWVYKQRYSEIKNIHEALIEQGFKNKLPQFPTRKLFGQTHEKPENIEKRKEDLETYLNSLFCTQEIQESQIIRFLISDSKKYHEKNLKLEELKKASTLKTKGDLNQRVKEISKKSNLQTYQNK